MSNSDSYVVVQSSDQSIANGIIFMVIASCIALAVSTCICVHFGRHLYKQYISKNVNKHEVIRGDLCILFGLQIISTFIRAIADLFMRTDYVTQSYDVNLCALGWFLHAYMPYLAKTFLILIIFYRTRIIFANSSYALNKRIFLALSIAVSIEIFIVGVLFIAVAATHSKPFVIKKLTDLPKGNNDYYSFCALDASYHGFLNLVTFIALILDLFWSSCAGYILISRLRKMRNDLRRMHQTEMIEIPTAKQNVQSSERDTEDAALDDTEDVAADDRQDVSAVTTLEQIMYKQTMLTVFALVSSILWALIIIVEKELLYGFAIDLATNLICSWLLFRFSNAVWVKVYQCCCYCCRYKG